MAASLPWFLPYLPEPWARAELTEHAPDVVLGAAFTRAHPKTIS